jgi:hypothetical protein
MWLTKEGTNAMVVNVERSLMRLNLLMRSRPRRLRSLMGVDCARRNLSWKDCELMAKVDEATRVRRRLFLD